MKQARLTEHFMNDRVDRYVTIATKVGFGETIKSVYMKDERNGEATTTAWLFQMQTLNFHHLQVSFTQ